MVSKLWSRDVQAGPNARQPIRLHHTLARNRLILFATLETIYREDRYHAFCLPRYRSDYAKALQDSMASQLSSDTA